MRRLRTLCLLILVALAPALHAQDVPTTLIADDISVTRDRVLSATGNVEVFQGDRRLQAQGILYDGRTGQMTITGPIRLDDGTDITILASSAELDRNLENGLLTSARLVLNEQLQLAAVEMHRVDGRFAQLTRTAVTSCRICENDPRPPLWQIRASRIIHDQEERQIYFEDAQLRIRNTPIFYLPRLRMPDPTLGRATGFLIPSIRTTSQLGTGIKVPYFFRLGDHRDLTVTPYLSGSTRTLELRYRQAYRRGRIEFNGAVTQDDIRPDDTRAYLFGFGQFQLDRGYVLDFDIEATTDDAYLKDYGYSDKDRLDSEIRVSRARRDKYVSVSYTAFRSLRDDEENSILPANAINGIYEKRYFPSAVGGELRLNVHAHAHFRQSSLLVDGPDFDTLSDGADVFRLNTDLGWWRTFTFGGIRAETELGVAGDIFDIRQDPNFPDTEAGVFPRAALTLRYPMVRHGSAGVTQYIEPVVQLGWTGGDALDIPNSESTRVEFDEGNLLSLSRFPAEDARELGHAVAYGVHWSRHSPDAWDAALTVGQVLRDDENTAFTQTSGLNGTESDFLLAGQVTLDDRLWLGARTVFNESLDFRKAELRGDWEDDRFSLAGTYVWLGADLDEERPDPINEMGVNGSYNIDRHWKADFDWRYDLEEGEPTRIAVGFTYDNECVSVGLGIRRRLTSSTSIEPTTDFGFSVSLKGFSTGDGTGKHTRACSSRQKAY